MGRAFEFRKARKMKRWGAMSRLFPRLGKEITMAAKNGSDPDTNSRLRTAIQNAKGQNMPKDRIDAAIKRATEKDLKDIIEIVYEAYGPHGVAIIIECAADNTTRTVANIRTYLSRNGGTLGTSGSLSFVFDRKSVFQVKAEGLDVEELELELIDFGLDEISVVDDELYIYAAFTDFGIMSKALEEKGLDVVSATLQRIPNTTVELTEEQEADLEKLIDKIEEDEDVQAVYTNMA
jgi:YebC/PmpR family DNA-binding regulatory protein